MSLKLHTITIKLKRAVIGLVSVSLALFLSILPFNFSVSALDDVSFNGNVVNLPFSPPSAFGNAPAFVMYNEFRSRYEYFVFEVSSSATLNSDSVYVKTFFINPPNNLSSSQYFGGYKFGIGLNNLSYLEGSPVIVDESVTVNVYWFTWYPNRTTYTFQRLKEFELTRSNNYVTYQPSLTEGTYFSYSSFSPYNGLEFTNLNSATTRDYVYVFQGSDGQGVMINRLNDIVGYNHEIVFYLNEILNKLGQGSDYAPSESTTNQDMSNYEQAEGALIDDNISNLNNLSLPDLGNLNSGQQGNAFSFISSNIEFFSGMNGSGSISKVGTVLVVILGLGLTSFILGLSNRRKGD